MKNPSTKKRHKCSNLADSLSFKKKLIQITCPYCKSSYYSVCRNKNATLSGSVVCPNCGVRLVSPDNLTVEITGSNYKEVMEVANNYYFHFAKQSEHNSVSDEQNRFSETSLCTNILKAMLHIQRNPTCHSFTENEFNDAIRDSLRMVYHILDQTRQGVSEAGKNAGSIDLLICKDDGLPFAIIEAMRLSSVDKAYIYSHIDKVLTSYDPVGCPYVFLLTYASCKCFDSFRKRFFQLLSEIDYPYSTLQMIRKHELDYSESCHYQVVLNRSDKEINVHFFTIHITE